MPGIRVQDEQGTIHVFPDGSTPDMIAKAMGVRSQPVDGRQALNAALDRLKAGMNQSDSDFSLSSGIKPNYLDSAMYVGKEALGGVADVAKGMYGMIKPPENTSDYILSTFPGALQGKRLIQGMMDTGKQAAQVPGAISDIAHSGNAMAALATSVPRATGQAAAMLAAPEVAKGIAKVTAPAEALSTVEAANQITDAINPPAREMPKMRATIAKHYDEIVNSGVKITDTASTAKAIKAAGDAAHQEFRQMLDPIAHQETDVAMSVPSYQGIRNGSTATLGNLAGRLKEVNDTLNPKYAKGGNAAVAAVGAENTSALRVEAAQIRRVLFEEMGDRLQVNPAEIAKTYQRAGALRDLGEKVQLASDQSRYKQNVVKNAPVDVKSSVTGLAAKGANEAYRYIRGTPAERAIKDALTRRK